ncbi:MAG: HEPN domain-containing protein [Bacteroidota bacterium]
MKKTFFSFGPDSFTAVINRIVSLVTPEKIFLISVIQRAEKSENIFLQTTTPTFAIESLGLLVLAAETDKRLNDELQDTIEHAAAGSIAITALVLPVHQFNGWLMKDHVFASQVYHEANLLYDAGIVPLAIPNEYSANLKAARDILDTHQARAVEFISGAELFIIRKQYALATFHLHQAAEQIYSGTIWSATGLRVHTHNLDKLYRYNRHFVPATQAVFPRDSGPEKQLFHYLQKAYVDGRYNSNFTIKYQTISLLLERVQKLLALCKKNPCLPTRLT